MMYSKRLMAVPDSTPALLRLDLGSRRDGLGLQELRVRHHDEIARLELGPAEITALLDPEMREKASRAVKAAGFRFVAVELEGYRRGSMNVNDGEGNG